MEQYSADVKVAESRDFLVNHLNSTAGMLNALVRSIQGHSEDHVDTEEFGEIKKEIDHVQSHVDEVREFIERVEELQKPGSQDQLTNFEQRETENES